MSLSIVSVRRTLLAAGLVAAFGAPLVAGLAAEPASSRVASCPGNEVLDPTTGACRPAVDEAPPTFSPINPEKAPLQPGSITSSEVGETGQLPEVNGIPCNGGNTGLCIGLTEENNMLEARPGAPGVSP
jgi:hypothetical protein